MWVREVAVSLLLVCVGCSSPMGPVEATAPPVTSSDAVAPPRCTMFDPASASEVGLSQEKLDRLLGLAKENATDALVIVKDGRVVVRWQREGTAERIETMSMTKSIASVAIGHLVDDGKLSLDDPMSRFFDAWKDDPRGAITLRHVLTHTSGLADAKTTEAIYASPDFVAFALDAALEHPPGTRTFYSNKAVNLLAGVVEKVTGESLATYAKAHLFDPIGARDVLWNPDPAGHTQVMAGLEMTALDVAKIGQLVLDEGAWCGAPVVSKAWIDASTRTYQEAGFSANGLLWWLKPATVEVGIDEPLIEKWRATQMPEAFIERLRPLVGKFFTGKGLFRALSRTLTGKTDSADIDADLAEWYAMTWKAGRPDGSIRRGRVHAINANGWLGQFLYVLPDERLVAVRMRHAGADPVDDKVTSFGTFEKELDDLVGWAPPG